MDADSATRFRALLIERRDALRAEGNVRLNPLRDDAASKVDEDLQPLNEMSQVIASSRNKNRMLTLSRIEAALKRLDRDPEEFGLCEECDNDIPLKRLELMPWTTICVKCLGAQEAKQSPGRRRHLADYT